MKIALFITGLVFFFGSFFWIKNSLQKFKVDREGDIVKMQIVSLPKSCIGAKVTYIVKLSYNGRIYDKQTRGAFCEEHHVGELIELKWIEGIDTVMFPFESGLFELISNILLGLFGLLACITIWRKRGDFG